MSLAINNKHNSENKVRYIRQPNHALTSRITLTTIEKNIIYTVLNELQQLMSADVEQVYKEQKVVVEIKRFEDNNNYSRIRKAIKSIASKQVEFQLGIPSKSGTVRRTEIVTSLISGINYEFKSEFITFAIPSDACRYFCYVGGGFTLFQQTIAISLSSIYSKLLYELYCRWRDRGGYYCSIVYLKELLSISEKYNQIAHLRNKVLNVAQRELKSKGDLFFLYTLEKTGRSFTHIRIKINYNGGNRNQFVGISQEHYQFVYSFLNRFFPNYENDRAMGILQTLTENEKLQLAYQRFTRLDDQFTKGAKTKRDIINLLIKVILPEFGYK